jgi:hypothetical protein
MFPNKKLVNCKVTDCIDSYKFGIDHVRASPRVMHLLICKKKLKIYYPMILHLDFAICITWHLEV